MQISFAWERFRRLAFPPAPNSVAFQVAGGTSGVQHVCRVCVLGCLGVFLLLASGCSAGDVELVDVAGYVTLDGQPPPSAGAIYFTPYEALGSQPMRPARADFASDGAFQARAFDNANGLVPAKYRVAIHCWKVAPSEEGTPGESYIPQRYTSADTSGLELVVPSGAGSVQWNAPLGSAD